MDDLDPIKPALKFCDADQDPDRPRFGGDDGGEPVPDKKGKTPTQAQLIIALAQDAVAELFHAGDESYVTFPIAGHLETHRLPSAGVKQWLQHQFFTHHKRPPAAQSMADAVATLAAVAKHDGPAADVGLRVMAGDGEIWLDLCDASWRAVRVTPTGWAIVNNPPVRFLRKRAMRSIPAPARGGDITELRRFVNVSDDDDGNDAFTLIVSWAVGALCPRGPYPALVVGGEQGACKSTACRVLRTLVDPNSAPLRAEPRDARDLAIAANNGWLLALDNVSRLPDWLSDALCRLATGGGFSTRQLYSDDDETIFDAMRPTMLNGIADFVGRPDLLERSLLVSLPRMPEGGRRTERELWAELDEARPRLLGALLDGVSAAMARLPGVHLDNLPRMADFAKWCTAAEDGLGWADGRFVAAYRRNRETANAVALEACAVAAAVVELVASRGPWTGSAKELLAVLNESATESTRRQPGWPKAPQALSRRLARVTPDLRRAGVEVIITRTASGRTILIESTGEVSSLSSFASCPPVATPETAIPSPDTMTVFHDGIPNRSEVSSCKNPPNDPENAEHDGNDANDGISHSLSAPVPDGWTRETWAARLRQMAERCEQGNPARAAELRAQATCVEPGE